MRIGEQYEHYRIVRLLDRGEFGDVYMAENTSDNARRVALKVVWKGLDEDAQLKQRAEKFGAELQKRLSGRDERIVVVYDYGFDAAGDLYIEMEYIDGDNLSEYIARGSLTPESAADIGEQLCGMLENLGNFSTTIEGKPVSAIVHGDLKPKNIRINARGQLKVLDFGIAKALSETRTHTQSHWASKAYASPERLDAGNVDMRSDLWSVGVLLYQMISGKLPFDAPTEQLETRIKSYIPPDPLPRTCPELLSNIVFKLLARDPAKRYLNAAEARQDLINFRAGKPVSAKPIDNSETRRVTAPVKESPGYQPPRAQTTARKTPAAGTIYSPKFERSPASAMKPVAVVLIGIVFASLAFSQYRVWTAAQTLRTDLDAEHSIDLEDAWKRYEDLEKRAWLPGSMWRLRQALKTRLAALGTEPIVEYRNSDVPRSYEKQWRDASGYLAKALDLDTSDKTVKGRMRLCEGHLNRILGSRQPSNAKGIASRQKYLNTAEARFHEAAELLPRSPDPYLGLARMYVYDLRDIEKAKEALSKAQEYGHPIANREKAEIADGYLSRVKRTWNDSRALADVPQQEREFLSQAKHDCSSATDLYQQVGAYGRAAQNLRALIQKCEQVDERLREIDQPGQTQ